MTHVAPTAVKPFLRALAGETLASPPIWLMRQAGRYLPEYRQTRAKAGSFLDLCYTPDLAIEVTLQPLRRYGFDAAILFSDILVIPDALGQKVSFREGEGPTLTPIRSARDLDALDVDSFLSRLDPVMKTVSGLAKAIPATTALIGFAGAPWTVATYMIEGGGSKDFTTVKRAMWENPDLFARLIDIIGSATTRYLIAQIEAGAEALQLFDSWAGILPEEEFNLWVIEPTKKIVSAIKSKYPKIPIIGFPKGSGILYKDYSEKTAVDGLSIDASVPLDWAAEVLQPHVTIQGNLDPALLLVGGQPMTKAVDRIKKMLGKGPFIFNLGHGITPAVAPETVSELIAHVRATRV